MKRARQTKKRRLRNRMAKSEMRTAVRTVDSAIAGDDLNAAKQALSGAIGKIGKTAQKGIIHRRTASRISSRLAKRLNAALATSQPQEEAGA